MLFNSVFTIFWDFNIQCRVCYTACSVNRRETVSLFKFPIKSLMIPFELNWPVSLITIYILYVIITQRSSLWVFFFAWTSSSEWWGKPKVNARKFSTLFTADAATILVWMHSFAGIFQILFSPLTNLSILMLNFTELIAADDYLNWILPKCTLESVC